MRTRRLPLVVFVALGVAVCGKDATRPKTSVASVTVTLSQTSVQEGSDVSIGVTLLDAEGNARTDWTVTWSSSDPSVATIQGSTATALSVGSTTITAVVDQVSGSSDLEVLATLGVQRSNGVTGSLTSGVSLHSKGSQVDYDFTAESGFENLVVTLDSNPVAQSGTLTMDASHLLWASAQRVIVVPADAQQLAQDAENLFAAADKVAAFQSLLDDAAELMSGLTDEESADRFDAISRSSNETKADFDALTAALAGQIFVLGGQSDDPAPSGPQRSGTIGQETTVIYVNGVWNKAADAAETAGLIDRYGRAAGLTWPQYRFKWAHNRTAEWLGDDLSVVADLVQAGAQVVDRWTSNALLTEDARVAVGRVQEELNRGRNVILMGHSQGNLMVQEALRELPAAALPCVGVVSLASPISYDVPSGVTWGDKFIVKGVLAQDLLLRLGLNDFKSPETSRTRWEDALLRDFIDYVAALPPTQQLIAQVVLNQRRLAADFRLHLMNTSYLAAPESRSLILDTIEETANELVGCRPQHLAFTRQVGVQVVTVPGTDPPETYEISLKGVFLYDGTAVTRLTPGFGVELRDLTWRPSRGLLAGVVSRNISCGADCSSEVGDLVLVNAQTGAITPLLATNEDASGPDFSPDGSELAFASQSGIHVLDTQTGGRRAAASSNLEYAYEDPSWSPDGAQIAFECDAPDGTGSALCVVGAGGGAATRIFTDPEGRLEHPRWSPDGNWFAYDGDGDFIAILREDGTGREVLVRGGSYLEDPTWSPDGTQIAYSCEPAICIVDVNSGQVSTISADGSAPAWWR